MNGRRKWIAFIAICALLTFNSMAILDLFAFDDLDCNNWQKCEKDENGKWPETCVFCFCLPGGGGEERGGGKRAGGEEEEGAWCHNYDCATEPFHGTASHSGECWRGFLEGWAECNSEMGPIQLFCYCPQNCGSSK